MSTMLTCQCLLSCRFLAHTLSHGVPLITCQIPGSSGTYNYRTSLCKQVKNKVTTVLEIGNAERVHDSEPSWSPQPPG